MPKLFRAFLLWTLMLCACSPGAASPQGKLPELPGRVVTQSVTPISTSEPVTDVAPIATTEIPPSTPQTAQPAEGAITVPFDSQQCAYQWAQQALPELSSTFQGSVQALQPEAQAIAFVFGENCVHPDGSATFLPMETDFNITLQVSDLTDTSSLGEWIVNVMQIIQNIPPDQIVGPRPGRVSIIFERDTERTGVSFYIDQYHALPAGLSNTEIFQALQTP
jgi:hypothetical protein